MSRILVLFASHFGQTRLIASRIADELRAHAHEVLVLEASARDLPSPTEFDAVVLGSRVQYGRHALDVRNYIARHRSELFDLPTAFFSVSMAASRRTADPNGYLATLFEDVGWTPTKQIAIAGGLPFRKYNWLLRMIMKRIAKSAGHTTDTSKNHELTDWDQVRTFASEVSLLVPAAPALHANG